MDCSFLAVSSFLAEAAATTTSSRPWLVEIFTNPGVAQAVVLLSLAAATGLALGSIKYRGIGLGIAGVLFTGLAIGHILGRFEIKIEPHILEFAREFGLILFVYSIGMQVGPGFIGSLRKAGLPLNLMAAAIVLIGVVVTVLIHKLAGVPLAAAVGLFSGGTTNTPSLGAAQAALRDVVHAPAEVVNQTTLGYAVAYPFGILGIIIVMLLIRWFYKVSLEKELSEWERHTSHGREAMHNINLEVKNPNLNGLSIEEVPLLHENGVVISRVMRNNSASVAQPDTLLQLGDVLHAVGPKTRLDQLKLLVGTESHVDVRAVPSNIASRKVVVTHASAIGETISELDLLDRFGVNLTRVNRAGVELPPKPNLKLQFADIVTLVGEKPSLEVCAKELGDSQKHLNHPQIIPIFLGIALGVVLGSWPVMVPGLPAPVKLGLAGGPLLVAIVLSRLGNIGPLVWYLPISANMILREMGIVLFLAAVGLKSGDQFIPTLVNGDGFYWMLLAAMITFIPLAVVGFFARAVMKLNYLTICGMLAGSMTDPPALAFAGAVTNSEAPSVSYATVYPLTMILRVLSAQVLIILLAS